MNISGSTVNLAFETNSLSGGPITAEVYANRMDIAPITGEIALPDASDPATHFMMSGTGTLSYSSGKYSGTVNVSRNVAKLRILVSKHPLCIPSNLIIDYSNIIVEIQQVPDRTQMFSPPPISTPAGLTYINYAPRTGTALRPLDASVLLNGGQIDSAYVNENHIDNSSYNNTNITRIKMSVPTHEPSQPAKMAEYTFDLYTNGSYQLKRNHIYTLDIKIAGQTLDPQITLDITPWSDVDVLGSILGTTLTLDKSEVLLTSANTQSNPEEIVYKTDGTSIELDWSGVNPAYNIDTTVKYIQGRDGVIKIFWNSGGVTGNEFSDTLYVRAGNIIKAIPLEYKGPSGNSGNWVGTFHRWNQTGERIIKIPNNGPWTATVTQGASFIIIDDAQTADSDIGTSTASLGNDAGFDASFSVGGTATTLSGNGLIYFRVGLTSILANASATPRYGVIEINTNEGPKYIYVRQGEEPDYVMRPQDLNPSNGNAPRSRAARFSPFNLTDPALGTGGNNISMHTDMSHGDAVFDSDKFTEYPSQAGYFFQWNLGAGTAHKAFHPANTITAINAWENATKASWEKSMEPCPAGYRHPNDANQNPVGSEIRQSLYMTPNSDNYGPAEPTGVFLSNSVWGLYADGFFDRLEVVTSPSGNDSTTVSFNSTALGSPENGLIAYSGLLIYNPVTNASLFFPAAGLRDNASGALSRSGVAGSYWTGTANGSNNGWAFSFTPTVFYMNNSAQQPSGFSVRCVRSEFGLPGSM